VLALSWPIYLKVQKSKFNKVRSYPKGFATPAPVKYEIYAFVKDSLSGECKTPEKRPQMKRLLDTPQGASPCRKTARVKSRQVKGLYPLLTQKNIDDFEQTEEL